jgi:hypothetical protein
MAIRREDGSKLEELKIMGDQICKEPNIVRTSIANKENSVQKKGLDPGYRFFCIYVIIKLDEQFIRRDHSTNIFKFTMVTSALWIS